MGFNIEADNYCKIFVTLQKKIAFYARTHFRNIAGHRFDRGHLHRVHQADDSQLAKQKVVRMVE